MTSFGTGTVERAMVDATTTIVEQTLFMLIVNNEDEAGCESSHEFVPHCDGVASYLAVCCKTRVKLCNSAVTTAPGGVVWRMKSDNQLCPDCGLPTRICWSIIPI